MKLSFLIILLSCAQLCFAQNQNLIDRSEPKLKTVKAEKAAALKESGRLTPDYYKLVHKELMIYREINPYGQNDYGIDEVLSLLEELEDIRFEMAEKKGRISEEYYNYINWLGPQYNYFQFMLESRLNGFGSKNYIAYMQESQPIKKLLDARKQEFDGSQRIKRLTITLIDPSHNNIDRMYLGTDLIGKDSRSSNIRNTMNQRMNTPDDNNGILLYSRIVKLSYLENQDKEQSKQFFNTLIDELIKYSNNKVAEFEKLDKQPSKYENAFPSFDSVKFVNDYLANYEDYFKQLEDQGMDATVMKQQIIMQAAQAAALNRASKKALVAYDKEVNREVYTPEFFKAYSASLTKIRSSNQSLQRRVEDFIVATENMYIQKTRKKKKHLSYTKSLKYKPEKLLRYLKSELNDPESKIKDNEKAQLTTVRDLYKLVGNLKSGTQISELRNENANLEEWGRYQNLFLNIALQQYQQNNVDLFNNKKCFVTVDEILAMKGADFRAKKYVLQGIQNSHNDALKKRYIKYIEERAQLAAIQMLPDSEKQSAGWTKSKINAKIDELRRFQSDLHVYTKPYVKTGNLRNLEITWKKIQQRLQPNEAVVSINRVQLIPGNEVKYLAFIVTKTEYKLLVLDNGKTLETKSFDAYKNAINFKVPETRSYDAFWDPISKELPGVESIYLSPDGVYHKISIGSLKNKSNQKYVPDEQKVILLNEISDFFEIKGSRKVSQLDKETILFGRPNYYSNTKIGLANNPVTQQFYIPRSFSTTDSIKDLPKTEIEVTKIAKTLANADLKHKVYLGKDASEENFKTLSNVSILHLATHGFFESDLPVNPKGDGFFSYDQKTFLMNPYLRSGLVLAGAGLSLNGKNKSEEDGILTAQEISFMSLDDTELVVMSACETGLGEVTNGEGVFGLQRAFLLAGANSTIISLWEVDDKATQELMVNFYENWITQKTPKREAFEKAKIQLREHYPEPVYWAAFQYLGK